MFNVVDVEIKYESSFLAKATDIHDAKEPRFKTQHRRSSPCCLTHDVVDLCIVLGKGDEKEPRLNNTTS